jgi:hypothetical protein
MRSLLRVIQSLLTFSRKSRRGFDRFQRLVAVSSLLAGFLASLSDLVTVNIFVVPVHLLLILQDGGNNPEELFMQFIKEIRKFSWSLTQKTKTKKT